MEYQEEGTGGRQSGSRGPAIGPAILETGWNSHWCATAPTNWQTTMHYRGFDVKRLTSMISYGIGRVDGVSFQSSTPRIDGEQVVLVFSKHDLVRDDMDKSEADDAFLWF